MSGSGQIDRMQSEQSRFNRYRPGPALSPFVRNYWTLSPANEPGACRRQRVIPDGCIDLIFVRKSPTEDFQAFAVGAMTRPIFVDLTAQVEYLGIRFAPGGFGHFFGTPAGELTDQIIPLDNLSASSTLVEQVANAPGGRTRLRIAEDSLNRRLNSAEPEPVLTKVLDTISASQGMVSVARLARIAGWSPRHLRRVFGNSVGVGPKTFCRIVRFKQALRSLHRRPPPDLLQAALEAGYYDQAHFIHDFHGFYGSSPSSVLKDRTS